MENLVFGTTLEEEGAGEITIELENVYIKLAGLLHLGYQTLDVRFSYNEKYSSRYCIFNQLLKNTK